MYGPIYAYQAEQHYRVVLMLPNKNYMKVVNLLYATVHYPSTKQSKYSNCTVSLEEICFHCHRQAHLIHHFDQCQMPYVDQRTCDPMQNPGKILIIFIKQVRPG